MFALFVLILPFLGMSIHGAVRDPSALFNSPSGLVLLSFLGLAIFLARAPLRWRQAKRDEAARLVREVRGHADIRGQRGIGLIAPTHETLHIGGQRFPLAQFWRDQIMPGLVYKVRFAPESRAILSISAVESRAVPTDHEPLPTHFAELSAREHALIRLLARGLTDKDIARALNLSPATVRTYNSELYLKLGIQRRGQVRALAERFGLLDDPADKA
ncbi:regulatory LuxR family protein [Maricaulis maris]|uniref:Regulatory LuxR family protein n=2 Tax=Maricaulis maris TaxID=74318 RepID=A0A495DDH4_9PROT|nr:regulatory LuxR family protein [Maricaulis maris]